MMHSDPGKAEVEPAVAAITPIEGLAWVRGAECIVEVSIPAHDSSAIYRVLEFRIGWE